MFEVRNRKNHDATNAGEASLCLKAGVNRITIRWRRSMLPKDFREPEVIIEESSRDEWTPLRGLITGSLACLVVTAIISAGWCTVAYRLPEATVCHLRDGARESMGPILGGAVVGFVSAWILFAVMHRFSHMVGGLCPYVVILMVTLIVLSKQAVLVVYGVKLPTGFVDGWEWMKPLTVLTSNLGTWIALFLAYIMFKDGESVSDMF